MRRLIPATLALGIVGIMSPIPAIADDLTALSLEQLANIQVTSVSKHTQRRSSAAAAIYVITGDDIRRSGATSIPEALRLAPGLDVARIDSNQWSIGVRGFGSRLARSVLVLIDGRSVYSPLFAGTYWEVQNTLLEDIDRIEVIRGPGGTLWGANAVNGVINIITKHAKDTHGTYLTARGGTFERDSAGFRYGGHNKDKTLDYRVYAKYFDRGDTFSLSGQDFDKWHMGQTGFRTDWQTDEADHVTVQGDAYTGKAGQVPSIGRFAPRFVEIIQRDSNLEGQNVLGRWNRQFSGSDLMVQTYYDRTFHRDPTFQETRQTYDLDVEHHIPIAERHDVIWGVDYRLTANDTEALPVISFNPSARTDHWGGLFLQDTFALVPDKLNLIAGTKFEHNDLSGWEFQPNGRLSWTPTDRQTVWTAVSRAVRTPSPIEQDLTLNVPLNPAATTFAQLSGNPDFRNEKVTAYEMGYRLQPADALSFDLAGFYNQYYDLLSTEPGTPFLNPADPTTVVVPYTFKNNLSGQAHGLEFVSNWAVRRGWRLLGEYSFESISLRTENNSSDPSTVSTTEGSTPRHQVLLQSSNDLPGGFEFTPTARYVDVLHRINAQGQSVPAYWNLDLRLSWHATKHVELALVGQNLIQPRHLEFGNTNEIQRGIYGQVTWRSW